MGVPREKTPNDELQKIPHTKSRKLESQLRLLDLNPHSALVADACSAFSRRPMFNFDGAYIC